VADGALADLERLLTDEREAIRRLDGARVLELAGQKQALFTLICCRASEARSPAFVGELRALMPQLRRNGVLLAHARNILRDAIAIVTRARKPEALPFARTASGSTLSVRG
jgi:hypothetical protein